MTHRTVTLRLSWLAVVLAGIVAVAPWGLVGWLEARYDPSWRETILAGHVAVRDSVHVLDSLRLEVSETERVLWRARTEEACRMLPFQTFEDCRLTIDLRLERR